ncbi:hypothetical protein FB567DRAFT_589730 [Paraphoma chrysanthemicola]|uniref:Uncharacterized protein n=1 Tax=Paraphoma chrysanthemicola TaxID=798071 RepID=A0A8K0W1S5_9PLEO|nr:hypothetical protein FB567DRAFT_589730 [Paraphoma chrysanthemicola]
MNLNERIVSLRGLWNQDTFVSFLWSFQGVLHFKSNLEDRVVCDMFQDKFFLLADAIVQYILTPKNIAESCRQLSTSTFIRSSIDVSPGFSTAYAKFKAADRALGMEVRDIGLQDILHVQGGDPDRQSRTKKQPRAGDGDGDGEEDEVRGDDRVAKKVRLQALVKATAGCHIIRGMAIEGTSFVFTMSDQVAENPIENYQGKGPETPVVIKAHKKVTLVEGTQTEEVDEGAGYASNDEDEPSPDRPMPPAPAA